MHGGRVPELAEERVRVRGGVCLAADRREVDRGRVVRRVRAVDAVVGADGHGPLLGVRRVEGARGGVGGVGVVLEVQAVGEEDEDGEDGADEDADGDDRADGESLGFGRGRGRGGGRDLVLTAESASVR